MSKEKAAKKSSAASSSRAASAVPASSFGFGGYHGSTKVTSVSGGPKLSVGFGGFVGSHSAQSVASSAASPAALSRARGTGSGAASPQSDGSVETVPTSPQVDGEIAMHFKRLTKRDPTTTLKALQALREHFQSHDANELVALLYTWSHAFKKLVLHNNDRVRENASKAMGALVVRCGKHMASHLKVVVPYWWLGCFDTNKDARAAASDSFRESFPNNKWMSVLTFCRQEVVATLIEFLRQDAQQLTDLKQATQEEALERQQRVHSQALNGLRELVLAVGTSGNDTSAAVLTLVKSSAVGLEPDASPLRQCLKPKSSSNIRTAAFSLMATLVWEDSQVNVREEQSSQRMGKLEEWEMRWAPILLAAALGEKDPTCLESAWRLALCLVRRVDNIWNAPGINLGKSLLPKLCSQLRNAAYGKAMAVAEGVLPLVATMPPQVFTLRQVIDACMEGAKLAVSKDMAGEGRNTAAMLSAALDLSTFVLGSASDIVDHSKDEESMAQAVDDEGRGDTMNEHCIIQALVIEGVLCPCLKLLVANVETDKAQVEQVIDASLVPFLCRLTASQSDAAQRALPPISKAFADFCTAQLDLEVPHDVDVGTRLVQLLIVKLHANETTHAWASELAQALGVAILTHPSRDSIVLSVAHLETLLVLLDCYGIICLTNSAEDSKDLMFGALRDALQLTTLSSDDQVDMDTRIHLAVRFVTAMAVEERKPLGAKKTYCSVSSAVMWEYLVQHVMEQRSSDLDGGCTCQQLDVLTGCVRLLIEYLEGVSTDAGMARAWYINNHLDMVALGIANDIGSMTAATAEDGIYAVKREKSFRLLTLLLGGALISDPPRTSMSPCTSILLISTPTVTLVLQRLADAWDHERHSGTQRCLSVEVLLDAMRLVKNVVARGTLPAQTMNLQLRLVTQLHAVGVLLVGPGIERGWTGTLWDEGLPDAQGSTHACPYADLLGFSDPSLGNLWTALLRLTCSLTFGGTQGLHDERLTLVQSAARGLAAAFSCLFRDEPVSQSGPALDELFASISSYVTWPSWSSQSGLATRDISVPIESGIGTIYQTWHTFAKEFGQSLGYETLLTMVPDNMAIRTWLIEELLCQEAFVASRDDAQLLLEEMCRREAGQAVVVASTASGSRDSWEIITQSVTTKLLTDADGGGTGHLDRAKDTYLSVAHVLLKHFLGSYNSTNTEAHQWPHHNRVLSYFEHNFVGSLDSPANRSGHAMGPMNEVQLEIHMGLVPIVIGALRAQQYVEGAQQATKEVPRGTEIDEGLDLHIEEVLSTYSCALMDTCTKILSDANGAPHVAATLHLVCDCFPHSLGGESHHLSSSVAVRGSRSRLTPQEELGVFAIYQSQIQSSMRLEAARAAEARFLNQVGQEKAEVDSKRARMPSLREEAEARMRHCALIYSFNRWTNSEFFFLFDQLRKGLTTLALAAEEELLMHIDSVPTAASTRTTPELCTMSDFCTHLIYTFVALLEYVPKQYLPTASLEDYSSDVSQTQGVKDAVSLASKWTSTRNESHADVLRTLLCVGACTHIQQTWLETDPSREQLPRAMAHPLGFSSELWEALGTVIIMSSQEEAVSVAISEFDAWDEVPCDSIGALHALIFQSREEGESSRSTAQLWLQKTALHLVSTHASLLTSCVNVPQAGSTVDADSEEDSDEDEGLDERSSLRVHIRDRLSTAGSVLTEASALAWALLLKELLSLRAGSEERRQLAKFARSGELVSSLLTNLFHSLDLPRASSKRAEHNPSQRRLQDVAASIGSMAVSRLFAIEDVFPVSLDPETDQGAQMYLQLYCCVLRALPASARQWFSEIRDRHLSASIEQFTVKFLSPHLLAEEIAAVQRAQISDDDFTVNASKGTGDVVVTYKYEEAKMQMVIQLSPYYPLRPIAVECSQRVGISESKVRKWLLGITVLLRNQNGGILEAAALWKENTDKMFEGLEECAICYFVVSNTDRTLPKMVCGVCRKGFHHSCMHRWFSSSGKSNCPHCQSAWTTYKSPKA